MPLAAVVGENPPISIPRAYPHVTPAPDIPARPPWLASVSAIAGEVAAAQIDPRMLGHLAGHLLRERIGYYWPKEHVRRRGPKGWREWDRSLFPGTLFFDIGRYDDRSTLNAAQDYCRYMGWRLGLVRASNGASQGRFRRELESLEILLGHDPTLSARNRIEPGRRVRVIAGFFEGREGIAVGEGPRQTLQVTLTVMNQCVPVEIAAELLEPLQQTLPPSPGRVPYRAARGF